MLSKLTIRKLVTVIGATFVVLIVIIFLVVSASSTSEEEFAGFPISVAVRDTVEGARIEGLSCTLYKLGAELSWEFMTNMVTSPLAQFTITNPADCKVGTIYKLDVHMEDHFSSFAIGVENNTTFYPQIGVIFERVDDGLDYIGISILASPYAYSAYRARSER